MWQYRLHLQSSCGDAPHCKFAQCATAGQGNQADRYHEREDGDRHLYQTNHNMEDVRAECDFGGHQARHNPISHQDDRIAIADRDQHQVDDCPTINQTDDSPTHCTSTDRCRHTDSSSTHKNDRASRGCQSAHCHRLSEEQARLDRARRDPGSSHSHTRSKSIQQEAKRQQLLCPV